MPSMLQELGLINKSKKSLLIPIYCDYQLSLVQDILFDLGVGWRDTYFTKELKSKRNYFKLVFETSSQRDVILWEESVDSPFHGTNSISISEKIQNYFVDNFLSKIPLEIVKKHCNSLMLMSFSPYSVSVVYHRNSWIVLDDDILDAEALSIEEDKKKNVIRNST